MVEGGGIGRGRGREEQGGVEEWREKVPVAPMRPLQVGREARRSIVRVASSS